MAKHNYSRHSWTTALALQRLQANNTTTVATIIRTALQAFYLLTLPRLVSTDTAAQVFLAISVSTVVAPLASLGSQFRLIKALAVGRENLEDIVPSYFIGFLVLTGVAGAVTQVYGIATTTHFFAFFTIYLLTNYARVFADTLAQAFAVYNLSQIGYIALWALKLLATWGLSHEITVNFAAISLLEVGISAPWICATCIYIRRHWPVNTLRVPWREDLQIIVATGVRSVWLEADRLLLPLFLGADSYVSYSIASRAAVGAQALIAAYLGVITPKIVRANSRSVQALYRSGVRITAIATVAYFLGAAAILVVYPSLSATYVTILILGLTLVPTYYAASIYSDYVFYNISASSRITINLLGASITIVGVGLTALTHWVPTTTIGLLASFTLGTVYAKYRIRKSSA